jgi:hypothetical protein
MADEFTLLDYVVVTMPLWLPTLTIAVSMPALEYFVDRNMRGYTHSEALNKCLNFYVPGYDDGFHIGEKLRGFDSGLRSVIEKHT